jgi:hypothetical protein
MHTHDLSGFNRRQQSQDIRAVVAGLNGGDEIHIEEVVTRSEGCYAVKNLTTSATD